MITEERIICGTAEELVRYFTITYNPILNYEAGNPIVDAKLHLDKPEAKIIYYYNKHFGSIHDQLGRLKNNMGMVFLIMSKKEDSEIPSITLEILKFWVFVRAPKANDA